MRSSCRKGQIGVTIRTQTRSDEKGAALVEFALIVPVFMMLVLGMFSGGMAYNRQLALTNATREGARYGATVPKDQCAPTSNCGGKTWTQLVQQMTVQRAEGVLDSAAVCVALVSGAGSAPTPVDAAHTTRTDGKACYVDNSADNGRRVQVTVTRADKLEALVFTMPLNLHASAAARFEQ